MKFFVILVPLFLISCQEETNPNSLCRSMVFSDALPVQFWPAECDTYNESESSGVHPICFCAPWKCDDIIPFQITDDPGQSVTLEILDGELSTIDTIELDEISSGIYFALVNLSDYDVCEQQISFKITKNDLYTIQNPTFEDPLLGGDISPWEELPGDGVSWSGGASIPGEIHVTLTSEDQESNVVSQDLATTYPAGDYKLRLFCSWGLSGDHHFEASAYLDNSKVMDLHVIDGTNLVNDTFDVSIPGPFNRIEFKASHEDSEPNIFTLRELQLYQEFDESYKSDCIFVSQAHTDTELIRYTNHTAFAGLQFPDVSPEQIFNLRIPCRFFHETFPEQQEAIELTSSVVTTSANIKTQRLLEIHHVPYYFHKKIQLALMAQYIEIAGKTWQKEEAYTINEGNKRWPMKSATCLLTERDSILRNVL